MTTTGRSISSSFKVSEATGWGNPPWTTAQPSRHDMINRPRVMSSRGQLVKIRLDRDVLAEAVQWAARSLPTRPSVPILAGLLVKAAGNPGRHEQLRLRDLGPDHGAGRQSPTTASRWSPAGCWPTSPAPCRTSRWTSRRTRPRWSGLRHGTVHPGDPPVADYPGSPGDARGHWRDPQRGLRQGRRPGRRRRRPRRAAAGVHRRPGGDRGRDPLPAGHRPLPDGAEGTRLESAHQPRRGRSPGAGTRAGGDGQVDDRRRPGDVEPLLSCRRRRPDRLRGHRCCRRPADHHPPAGRRVPERSGT